MDLKDYARTVAMETGVRVRRAREDRGFTRTELAARAGHTPACIAALEDGTPNSGARLRELTSVFTALGLDVVTTVERAAQAVRAVHGSPTDLPPVPVPRFQLPRAVTAEPQLSPA